MKTKNLLRERQPPFIEVENLNWYNNTEERKHKNTIYMAW